MKIRPTNKQRYQRWLSRLLLIIPMLLMAGGALAPGGIANPLGAKAGAVPSGAEGEDLPPEARVETVLTDMYGPVDMVFDADGRLFYTEKNTGNVRLFHDGILEPQPVIHFDVASCAERGITGITLDPDFRNNHYIYVYFAKGSECVNTENNVVRFTESNGIGANPVVIFRSPAYDQYHMGGGLHFGPDGKLYISIGDTSNASLAQDLTVPQGKIHRINADGSDPSDNPHFSTPGALGSIYAYGFRNPFDYTFDPLNGNVISGENGPDCDDEINLVLPGNNYGWRPDYPCQDQGTPDAAYNTIDALWYADPCCIAPTGIAFYTGDDIPEWKNTLFVASFYGKFFHFTMSDDRKSFASAHFINNLPANQAVMMGPDGALYFIQGGAIKLGTLKRIVGPNYQETTVKTALPRVPYAAPVPIPGDESYTFNLTGKTINGLFLDYWRDHGGLEEQGYPISDVLGEFSEVDGKLYAVQYFERAVFEYHPELNPPFRVELAQLGRMRYKQLYPDGAPDQHANAGADAVQVPETGMHIGGEFLAYYNRTGGVAQHGYPISEEFMETSASDGKPYLVQYFERSVFEYHPENAAPFDVLLSQLGRFVYKVKHTQ